MQNKEKLVFHLLEQLKNIQDFSLIRDRVLSVIDTYQSGVNGVINDSNGIQNAEDYLTLRNKEIIDFLAQKGIILDNFLHPTTGAPYIKKQDIKADNIPHSVVDFFQISGNTLSSGGPILSGRGLNYYFQFPGIKIEGNPLSINTSHISREDDSNTNLLGLSQYCNSIITQLKKVRELQFELAENNMPIPGIFDEKWKEKTQYNFQSLLPLSDEAKRLLLVLLDHEKNILLFLANIFVILLDDNFLNPEFKGNLVFSKEQVVTLIRQNPDGYKDFKELQKNLLGNYDVILGDLIHDIANIGFLDVLFSNEFTKTVNSNVLTVDIIVRLLHSFLKFLEVAVANGKKNSKTKKVNWDKLFELGALKVIRFSREEDDIRAMTISMFSLAQRIISKVGRSADLDIYGIMYGGIELPFILDDILRSHFFGFHGVHFSGKISLHLVSYSIYDLKNRSVDFNSQNYPGIDLVKSIEPRTKRGEIRRNLNHKVDYILGKEKTWNRKKLAVILDDNLFSGDTISGFERLLREEGKYDEVMSQVSTVMIDNREGKRMKQSTELLGRHVINTGKTLPVIEFNGKYGHPIVNLIGKRVEKIRK